MSDDLNKKGLSPNDYKMAIFAQDACNLSGIAHSFSKVLSKIWEEANALGKGTDWVNKHPICILYVSKMSSLANSENLHEYAKAYEVCNGESKKCD